MNDRSDSIAQVAQAMRDIDFCMLTTRARDGALHSRPMSNNGEVAFDGDVWFFSAAGSRKVAEIEADARVSLAYSDARRGVWIALEGRGEIVRDVPRKRELWLEELRQWFQDGPESSDVVLIRIAAERAERYGAQEGVVELG